MDSFGDIVIGAIVAQGGGLRPCEKPN